MVNFTVASSNFSEGISRQNITPSRSACRNLFGTVDHDEIREEERKQNIERLREKRFEYNFDFEKGTPLEGRYVWERVPNIANRYENRSGRGTAEEENGSGTTDSQITEISTKKHLPTSQPIEQKITDYFRAKKRKNEETTTGKDFPKTSKVRLVSKASLNDCCDV